ncbi:MAG: Flp family type IVb pilin [Christensenella sp.]|nr:Flp family type IVb pilin [Christensenella sp.]
MKQFIYCEAGQGLVEYGLIILLVALVVVGSLTVFGNNVTSFFAEASEKFN